jgi:hypothetical protein
MSQVQIPASIPRELHNCYLEGYRSGKLRDYDEAAPQSSRINQIERAIEGPGLVSFMHEIELRRLKAERDAWFKGRAAGAKQREKLKGGV